MDCVNYYRFFWKSSKNLFELSDQKWSSDGPLKTKTSENLSVLKVVPGTF